MSEQLTKEQAIAFYDSKSYESMSLKEKAVFQLQQEKLCMPIEVFHEAVEKTVGYPVFTHEFGNPERLKELLHEVMKNE